MRSHKIARLATLPPAFFAPAARVDSAERGFAISFFTSESSALLDCLLDFSLNMRLMMASRPK